MHHNFDWVTRTRALATPLETCSRATKKPQQVELSLLAGTMGLDAAAAATGFACNITKPHKQAPGITRGLELTPCWQTARAKSFICSGGEQQLVLKFRRDESEPTPHRTNTSSSLRSSPHTRDHNTERYLHAIITHVTMTSSGKRYTWARSASLTTSPRHSTISEHILFLQWWVSVRGTNSGETQLAWAGTRVRVRTTDQIKWCCARQLRWGSNWGERLLRGATRNRWRV